MKGDETRKSPIARRLECRTAALAPQAKPNRPPAVGICLGVTGCHKRRRPVHRGPPARLYRRRANRAIYAHLDDHARTACFIARAIGFKAEPPPLTGEVETTDRQTGTARIGGPTARAIPLDPWDIPLDKRNGLKRGERSRFPLFLAILGSSWRMGPSGSR